jgi:hypothetical protein
MRYQKETAMDDQIAFEATPDGALALEFQARESKDNL